MAVLMIYTICSFQFSFFFLIDPCPFGGRLLCLGVDLVHCSIFLIQFFANICIYKHRETEEKIISFCCHIKIFDDLMAYDINFGPKQTPSIIFNELMPSQKKLS